MYVIGPRRRYITRSFRSTGRSFRLNLPAYVKKEFDQYLKSGRLEHGFLRIRCAKSRRPQADSAALLVDDILPYQAYASMGFINPFAQTGALTLIQRFGGALNLYKQA